MRLAEHEAGERRGYTSARRPVTLVFAQKFSSREEALALEGQMKGWSRKKKEAMMRGHWAAVSQLTKGER